MADAPLIVHAAWILPLLLAILYLHSPRFRGDIAESRVRRILAAGLEKSRYTLFNDLVLPAGGGSVTIDHVVVSRLGIFVIESVYARGWISGSEQQERWSQRHWWHTSRLDNPIHRNRVQREALQRLLDYPPRMFHELVVIVGSQGFRKRPPENTVSPERLLDAIRKKSQDVLSAEQANHAISLIDRARLRSPGRSDRRRWNLLRAGLWLALACGLWLAFHDRLTMPQAISLAGDSGAGPAQLSSGDPPKTEQELWEDSLTCAYSIDTGRCACYEPGGQRAAISAERCRELAERGSILRQ